MNENSSRPQHPASAIQPLFPSGTPISDLGAVSMARVAERLGNSTMALYRHVKRKDELLVLMSDAAVERPDPMPEGIDWRTGLTFWADNAADFDFGLQLFLDGVAAFIERVRQDK